MAVSLLIVSIPLAFVLTGIQSIIFSFVMEFIVLAKVSDINYVIASGFFLGVLSSFFMGTMSCVVGAIIGGLSSFVLFRRYKQLTSSSNWFATLLS